MSRKVLFLDIDGVLQTGSGHIEPGPTLQLQRVVEATGCLIVISSAWRLGWSLDEIDSYLRAAGYTGPKPIGTTPDYGRIGAPRGLEIAAYLAQPEGRKVTTYAVVDDYADMETCGWRLVQTKRLSGLDEVAADELIEMLNGGES